MKINLLLLAAFLSVAGRGFASDINVILDSPSVFAIPGDLIHFTGSITNNDPSIVDLNFIDVNLNSLVFSVDESPFFSGPVTVDATTGTPLSQTTNFDMFDVSVALGAPLGPYIGTVDILGGVEGPGGYDPTAQTRLGSATFHINVVPEPSTLAYGFVTLGVLYLLRLRRNQSQAMWRRHSCLPRRDSSRRISGGVRISYARRGTGTLLCGAALWLALAISPATGQTPAEQCALPRGAGQSTADDPVAVVAGQPILKSDLDEAVKSTMMALHNQEFQIKSRTLDDLIRQRVVEAEARQQGLTVEQLYAKEVDARIPTPIDAEVYAYYLGVRSQINKPFQEVRAQLQANLKALEVQQMRSDYVDYLRGKTEVAVMFQPPRVGVDYDRDRLRGDGKAPVTIVEFADYQCPYCEKVEASIREVLAKYPGKVNVAYRDFPLTAIHPYAQKASEAARCAGKQGKFWEYHDALFDPQAKLDDPGLKAQAHTLGLDEKAFASCLDSGEFARVVAKDQEDGKKAGIASTPGFFINGIFLNGAQPAAEFEKIIDSELKSATSQTTTASR